MIPSLSIVARTLNEAIAHHSAGRLGEAERLYRAILSTDPRHGEANHNLGAVYASLDQYEKALPFFQSAFETNKKQPQFRLSLIEALIQTGDYQGAGQLLVQAQRLGLTDPAFGLLRQRLNDVTTGGPAALEAALRHKDFARAEKFAADLTRDQPQVALGWYGMAIAMAAQGRPDDAIPAFERAWNMAGPQAESAYNIGRACQDRGQMDQALGWYQTALILDCTLAAPYGNICRLAQDAGQPEIAILFAERAWRLEPSLVVNAHNLAVAFENAGELEQAVKGHERAAGMTGLEAKESAFSLALLRLLTGDFEQGWAEYEARFDVERLQTGIHLPKLPRWSGDAVRPGTKILLLAEQGLGDAIQFARYAPLVQARGFAVTLALPKPLVSLFTDQWPGIRIAELNSAGRAYDYFCPLMSLPRLFKTDLNSVPAGIPYIQANPERTAAFAGTLQQGKKIRVGLTWSGSSAHIRNNVRSIPLAQFAPLFDLTDVEFHAVQTDIGPEDRALAARYENFHLHDGQLTDFQDTAALMSCLDLVIGVDTAPIHLAGALGRTAWIALHKIPDFRWMLNRTDSPWYPSMRMFRQQAAGDWSGVMMDLTRALQSLIGGY